MEPATIIALCSVVMSVLIFVSTQFSQRHVASTDYVSELEKRIETLERELATANVHIHDLEQQNAHQLKENIALLRKLVLLENGK